MNGEGVYVVVTPWRSVRVCYGCKHCPVHVEGKPTMAAKLERFDSPGKGNGLRATAGIKRGQLVYSAEPLACCVSNKLARDVCHRCFTRWDRRSSEGPASCCERRRLLGGLVFGVRLLRAVWRLKTCLWLVSAVWADKVDKTRRLMRSRSLPCQSLTLCAIRFICAVYSVYMLVAVCR